LHPKTPKPQNPKTPLNNYTIFEMSQFKVVWLRRSRFIASERLAALSLDFRSSGP